MPQTLNKILNICEFFKKIIKLSIIVRNHLVLYLAHTKCLVHCRYYY